MDSTHYKEALRLLTLIGVSPEAVHQAQVHAILALVDAVSGVNTALDRPA